MDPKAKTNQRIQPAANGPIVTHFQPSNKGAFNPAPYDEFITDDYCVDRESVRRKFGWGTLGNTHHIPFIYRNGDKYCAVRMVDKYIFDDYLAKISDNIYFACTNILGYYITVPESILLNEINEFHCDNFYGTMPFKQGDVLVKLEEANQFYEFLLVCSNKLFNTPCEVKRCGFLTLNEKSMVPYIVVDDEKLLPLFYIDTMEGIKFKVKVIKGWNLSYLKFCFKVHGIRDAFCNSDDCRVVSLGEVVQHLEPGEYFKEWWPEVLHLNKGIYQPKKINKHQVKPWHEHPITVLPISTLKNAPLRNAPTNVTTNGGVYYRTISHS